MNVSELRTDLHKMIDKIDDSYVLNAVRVLLSDKVSSQTDWWERISEDERLEIQLGMDEADRGEVIPHDEVMNKYRK
jgi:predicted transcriptional regulator